MEKFSKAVPMFVASEALRVGLSQLDWHILETEQERDKLREEVRRLREENYQHTQERVAEANYRTAAILNACMGKGRGMSADAATHLAKIREMKTIEEVHRHIAGVFATIEPQKTTDPPVIDSKKLLPPCPALSTTGESDYGGRTNGT